VQYFLWIWPPFKNIWKYTNISFKLLLLQRVNATDLLPSSMLKKFNSSWFKAILELFEVSMLKYFNVSMLQCFKMLQRFSASMLKRFNSSVRLMIQCCNILNFASMLQCFNALIFKSSALQHFHASLLQNSSTFYASTINGSNSSMHLLIQCCNIFNC